MTRVSIAFCFKRPVTIQGIYHNEFSFENISSNVSMPPLLIFFYPPSLIFSRYLSVETRQELLRIENSWNTLVVQSVIKLGVSPKKLLCRRRKMQNLIQLL